MADLAFACVGVDYVRHAVGPTLRFTIRITEKAGQPVHAIALRCQFRVEPKRRRYSDAEAARLADLFGDRSRWSDTQHPMQLATVAAIVPSFTGGVDVDVDVTCTYDMQVATGKYFEALDDGEVPLLVLFSGTIFTTRNDKLDIEQVPWHNEAQCRLPVAVWRAMMDDAFEGSGWVGLSRESIDALRAFATREAIPTWDLAVERLLKEAE